MLKCEHLITDASVKTDYIASVRISQNTSIKVFKDTRHLHFNRTGRNVEFALQPQHETSFDLKVSQENDLDICR